MLDDIFTSYSIKIENLIHLYSIKILNAFDKPTLHSFLHLNNFIKIYDDDSKIIIECYKCNKDVDWDVQNDNIFLKLEVSKSIEGYNRKSKLIKLLKTLPQEKIEYKNYMSQTYSFYKNAISNITSKTRKHKIENL